MLTYVLIIRYPEEKEILLPPMSGLEVKDYRTEGATLIVSVRLSINLQSETIEKV